MVGDVLSADGWIKLWRKTEDSDVWKLPPVTRDIWMWILMHANREAKTVFGVDLQPGELLTSYAHIADGVAWYENRSLKKPTTDSVRWALKKLELYQTIRHEVRQSALWIKVLHWQEYQTNGNGDHTRDHTREHDGTTPGPHQDHTTKQEEKKKKETLSLVEPLGFDEFWSLYPRRVSKGQAQRALAAALKKTDIDTIIAALERQLPDLNRREKKYIPYPSTWLNGERWEDDVTVAPAEHYDEANEALMEELMR